MVSKSDKDPMLTPATRLHVPLVEQVHLRTQFIQSRRVVQTFVNFISLPGIKLPGSRLELCPSIDPRLNQYLEKKH